MKTSVSRSLEFIKQILCTDRSAAEEAKYLLDQYGDEAMAIAAGCHREFDPSSKDADFWHEVCSHICMGNCTSKRTIH